MGNTFYIVWTTMTACLTMWVKLFFLMINLHKMGLKIKDLEHFYQYQKINMEGNLQVQFLTCKDLDFQQDYLFLSEPK